MECSICGGSIKPHKKPSGEIYWTKGNNAEPVADGIGTREIMPYLLLTVGVVMNAIHV